MGYWVEQDWLLDVEVQQLMGRTDTNCPFIGPAAQLSRNSGLISAENHILIIKEGENVTSGCSFSLSSPDEEGCSVKMNVKKTTFLLRRLVKEIRLADSALKSLVGLQLCM